VVLAVVDFVDLARDVRLQGAVVPIQVRQGVFSHAIPSSVDAVMVRPSGPRTTNIALLTARTARTSESGGSGGSEKDEQDQTGQQDHRDRRRAHCRHPI
jgi:hypothetical protein